MTTPTPDRASTEPARDPCYTCDHVHDGPCGQWSAMYDQPCNCDEYDPDPWREVWARPVGDSS